MRYFFVFLLCVLSFPSYFVAQTVYPADYFVSPMETPLSVSGTFGELRSNHFHSGIDFRTGGTIGRPVYAAAEGYVSRIKVSSSGGGKTLYITHPNGYKSVYMHLDKFTGKIADYVLAYQYEKKVFEFDIELASEILTVTKGQLIAKSGNTGSSGGPHLHFEIREADNDRTINPLFFGLKLCDQTSPTINSVKIYPADKSSLIDNKNQPYSYTSKKNIKPKSKSKKAIKPISLQDTIPVWGKCYFGIDMFDKLCNSVGKKGIYKLNLYVDTECVFTYCLKSFFFEDTRAANSLIDFAEYQKIRKYYILTRLLDFIPLSCYERVKDKGYYTFTDQQIHQITWQAFDYAGNSSKMTFWLKSVKPEKLVQEAPKGTGSADKDFIYSKKNTFSRSDFFVEIDEGTLYESIIFDFQSFSKQGKHYPMCYRVHNENVPLHKSYRLGIKAGNVVPVNLRSKAFIARLSKKNTLSYEESRWENDFLVASPRAFGMFVVALDTVSPKIKPLNFKNGVPLKNNILLKIKITDNFSGVAVYNCYLNDNWILAEYDRKNALLTIELNDKFKKGNNNLKVIVKDMTGNEIIENYTF